MEIRAISYGFLAILAGIVVGVAINGLKVIGIDIKDGVVVFLWVCGIVLTIIGLLIFIRPMEDSLRDESISTEERKRFIRNGLRFMTAGLSLIVMVITPHILSILK